MVSKNQRKLIKSLNQKKYRKQHGLFVAEGKKVIHELVSAGLKLHALYTTEVVSFSDPIEHYVEVDEKELKSISFLTTPQWALAVFYMPKIRPIDFDGLVIALDDIRDPGNLGTIIRLCDWFGVEQLLCSKQTVDCYNPKVIQATMGSITRVNIVYANLIEELKQCNTPCFGTFMDGDRIYEQQLPNKGVIVMGNEANGISSEIESIIEQRIAIPRFGTFQKTESLNVATATAIILNEFRRTMTTEK